MGWQRRKAHRSPFGHSLTWVSAMEKAKLESEGSKVSGVSKGGDQVPSPDSDVGIGAGLVSVARGIGGVLTILTTVCLARALSRGDFAVVAAVHLLRQTAQALGTLGLQSSLLYYRSKLGPSVERALATSTGLLLLGLAVPLSVASYLFAGPVARLVDVPAAEAAMVYLAVFLLADFPSSVLPNAMLARRSYRQFFFVTLVFEGGTALSLIAPALLGADVATILQWFVLVAAARLVLAVVYVVAVLEGRFRQTAVSMRELFMYGTPLALSSLVGRLNQQLDKYLVALVASADVFAVYTLGALELPLVQTLAYSVTQAILPELVERHQRGDIGAFVRLWHASMYRVALIMMPTFLFILVCAEPIVVTLFSRKYESAAIPMAVYAFLLPLRLCAYGGIVRALGKSAPVFWSAAVGLIVNAALTIPLYHLIGLAGPALAAVLAQLSMVAWLLYAIRAALGIAWRDLLPIRQLTTTSLIALGATPPLLAIVLYCETPSVQLILGALVYVPAYILLSRRFGTITSEEWRYLVSLAKLGSPTKT